MIPVGGEARKEDSLCVSALPAGWVCGMICALNTERQAQRETQAMCEQGDVTHLNLKEQGNPVQSQLQKPI